MKPAIGWKTGCGCAAIEGVNYVWNGAMHQITYLMS